ncbi:muscarinic acetylcholine receptor M3-like [Physella acuta]|uniref:muscarinic acetylcholine receptor M3-like n=1 Tax=Physella acuta TaxID=109671 RepID=UPI0027DD8105|nr:muscarinic acetylcholine receptor M3-like [Physella acuta]
MLGIQYPCAPTLMAEESEPRPTFLMVWLKAIPLVFLAFSTLSFNVIVLWMFKVKKSLRSCKNIYLASLAIADLIIGVCMFVATVQQLKGAVEWLPFVWCRFYLVVRQSALYVSLLSLLLVTGDRWWSIHYPFSYRTRRRKKNAFIAVGCVWFVGFAVQVIPVIVWDYFIQDSPESNSTDMNSSVHLFPSCELPFAHSISFVAIVSAIQYLLPLVAMLTLNCSLYVGILGRKKIQIRRSLNSSDKLFSSDKRNSLSSVQDLSSATEEYAELLTGLGHRPNYMRYTYPRRNSAGPVLLRASTSVPAFSNSASLGSGGRRFSWAPRKTSLRPSKDGEELAKNLLVKQDRRAACWLGLLVIVFLICWLPHTVVGILLSARQHVVPVWARDLTFWLLLANSAINPLLYGFFNKEIREAFKQWMRGGSNKRQVRMKNAIFIYGVSLNSAIPQINRRISSFDTVPE